MKAITTLLLTLIVTPLCAGDGRIPITSVPFNISSPGSYYLTRDFTVASGSMITINASQVTLDLNGHTLTNNSTALNNNVIVSPASLTGLRVTGGRLVGGYYGVFLSGLSGAELQVDHLSSSGAGSNGIYLTGAGANPARLVVEAVQVSSQTAVACIFLVGASGGRISDSGTQRCYNGIQLDNTRGMIVAGNTVADSTNNGILLTSGSRDNLITGNTVQKSTVYGIFLSLSRGNRVVANVVSNNSSSGIFVAANNNTISENIVTENSGDGIELYASGNTLISRNTITGTQSGGGGIDIHDGSTYNTLDGNESVGNVGYGVNIVDAASFGNIYSNNRVMHNPSGNNFGTGNFSAGGNNQGSATNF